MKQTLISLLLRGQFETPAALSSNMLVTLSTRPLGAEKWCEHCRKDTHNDAECWSTRVVHFQRA